MHKRTGPSRRAVLKAAGAASAALSIPGCRLAQSAEGSPNVLLLMVEGLRPDLGRALMPELPLPAIDELIAAGNTVPLIAGAATAMPSAAALWTGVPAYRHDAFDDDFSLTRYGWGWPTLPEQYKEAGYTTAGFGRLCSSAHFRLEGWHEVIHAQEGTLVYQDARNLRLATDAASPYDWQTRPRTVRGGPLVEVANDPFEERYTDVAMAGLAVDAVGRLSKVDRPWFVAVGFQGAAMPLCVPQRLMPKTPGEVAGLDWAGVEGDAFDAACDRVDYFSSRPQKPATMIAAYGAALRLIDEQVGRLMHSLEASGRRENTRVALVGTHALSLGSKGVWGDGALVTPVAETMAVVSKTSSVVGRSDAQGANQQEAESMHMFARSLMPDPNVFGDRFKDKRAWVTASQGGAVGVARRLPLQAKVGGGQWGRRWVLKKDRQRVVFADGVDAAQVGLERGTKGRVGEPTS